MEITIRKYLPSDKIFLIKSLEELLDYLVALDTWNRSRRHPNFGEDYTDALLKRIEVHSGIILIAECDGIPAGIAAGIIECTDEMAALECYPITAGNLVELCVKEEFRKQGIGKWLMQHIENYFREKGCTYARTEVFAPNKEAHNFYHHLGYHDRDIHLLKPL